MAVRLGDQEIAQLLEERKELPDDFRRRLSLVERRSSKQAELELRGDNGHEFRLILRQSKVMSFDFSVILAYRPADSTEWFRLRRHNGRSHEHSNPIEREPRFYGYHVHTATERYQELGMEEDAFAEVTDRFSDLASGLDCMLRECGFVPPLRGQGFLFQGDVQ